jgi:hypothetical protein
MKRLLVFGIALLVLVGCSSAPKHKMPTSMDQHGTPSYLNHRDKGLFYGLIVNYSDHMIVVEILDFKTRDVVWTSKTLLTEEESLKRNPQKDFKNTPHELRGGQDHVCPIYLREGTYIMRISKFCNHTQSWKLSAEHKFMITRECGGTNVPCFDVDNPNNKGPIELGIYEDEKKQHQEGGCCSE